MTEKLTTYARVLLAALAIASFAAPARAQVQNWPTKPVKILIPFTAGGTADTLGRLAAQKLSETLGQQFVPEQKTGASGLIAAAEAGATSAIQPGGSVRDAEVISAANERNMAMIFTGVRHFRH